MFTRTAVTAVAAFLVFVLAGYDETSAANACKGLSEAECAANNECIWKAEKAVCKKKESDQTSPQESAPEKQGTTPGATPDTTPGDTPQ